ncbi:MAG: UvrD-helicase domain-containing protein, partial [Opitutae bacterium]
MINLNNEQRVAAEATDKNVLVLAGAGTGKTTTLVGRYAFLLNQSVPPEAIFCATFSRKAADEMLHRLRNQLKVDLSEALVGTFHSLAVRILRQLGNSIGLKPDFE